MVRASVWEHVIPLREVRDEMELVIPKGGRLISVANRREELTLYILSPTSIERTTSRTLRRLLFVGTHGEFTLPADTAFLGTVTFASGSVYHVWDAGEVLRHE